MVLSIHIGRAAVAIAKIITFLCRGKKTGLQGFLK
jgi:hypothetical protein